VGRASTESKTGEDGLRQAGSATVLAPRRFRASSAAWGVVAAILLSMLALYVFSMYAGGMDHAPSGDTTASQDPTPPSVAAPVAEGQMVMPDGSVMDMGQHPAESVAQDQMVMPDGSVMNTDDHPAESPGSAVTEAGRAGTSTAASDHEMNMGGAVNWYIIGGILAVISALVAVVAGLKERLARGIAAGAPTVEAVSCE
jgi:hypothetical protein